MSEIVTREDFAECLDSVFQVGGNPVGTLGLTLKQVSELGSGPGQESFSLIFRGPAEHRLPQGTYPFGHGRLGVQQIFIVPVAGDERGISYEAVFNRLVP